jgi:hypothetical protein
MNELRGSRMQYGFLLHINCCLLINMLENFIKFRNFCFFKKFEIIKAKNLKFKILKFQKFLFFFFIKFKIVIQFQNFQKFHKISQKFKMIKFSKSFKVFIKFQN